MKIVKNVIFFYPQPNFYLREAAKKIRSTFSGPTTKWGGGDVRALPLKKQKQKRFYKTLKKSFPNLK